MQFKKGQGGPPVYIVVGLIVTITSIGIILSFSSTSNAKTAQNSDRENFRDLWKVISDKCSAAITGSTSSNVVASSINLEFKLIKKITVNKSDENYQTNGDTLKMETSQGRTKKRELTDCNIDIEVNSSDSPGLENYIDAGKYSLIATHQDGTQNPPIINISQK